MENICKIEQTVQGTGYVLACSITRHIRVCVYVCKAVAEQATAPRETLRLLTRDLRMMTTMKQGNGVLEFARLPCATDMAATVVAG